MNPNQARIPLAAADDSAMGGGGSEARSALAETKDKIAETAKSAASKVKTAAADTATKAREKAERVVSEKKETAAARIGNYSSAIHESARSLEEKDPNIAWFTHRAADRVQGVADYLRKSDWNCLRGDCEGIARRHPAVFFGGMFFGGLLIGNLLKASGRKVADRRNDDENSGEFAASEAGADWMAASHQGETPNDLPTSVPGTGI